MTTKNTGPIDDLGPDLLTDCENNILSNHINIEIWDLSPVQTTDLGGWVGVGGWVVG